MKIETVMTTSPTACSSSDHLATAARKMWEDDCGILPVVDDGRLAGVITDRDIAMALAMKGATATEVAVGDVITGNAAEPGVFGCEASDEVAKALDVMAEHRVRRLPVLDGDRLVGILSLNDIVLEAASKPGSQKRPTYAKIVKALQSICEHRKLPVAA